MSWALKAKEVPSMENWRRAFQTEGMAWGKAWSPRQHEQGAVGAELHVTGMEDEVPLSGRRQSPGEQQGPGQLGR